MPGWQHISIFGVVMQVVNTNFGEFTDYLTLLAAGAFWQAICGGVDGSYLIRTATLEWFGGDVIAELLVQPSSRISTSHLPNNLHWSFTNNCTTKCRWNCANDEIQYTGTPIRWLSAEAVQSERMRRRMEHECHINQSYVDPTAYRKARRHVNRLINSSHSAKLNLGCAGPELQQK